MLVGFVDVIDVIGEMVEIVVVGVGFWILIVCWFDFGDVFLFWCGKED